MAEWLKIIGHVPSELSKLWARKIKSFMDFSPYSAYLSHLLMQGLEVTGCHKAEYEIILNLSHQVDSKYIHLPQLSSSFYGAFSAHLCFLILSNVCQPEPSSCRGLAKDHSMSCILNKKPPNLIAVKDALSGCWLHLLLASWNVSSAVTCSLTSKMLARKKTCQMLLRSWRMHMNCLWQDLFHCMSEGGTSVWW